MFTVITSAAVWYALKATMGLRPSQEDEMTGMDMAEIGVEAYPEWGQGGKVI